MHNPIIGRVTSEWAPRRRHPVTGKLLPHEGIDIASGTGKGVVRAAYAGRVERAGNAVISYRSGNGILIRNPDGEANYYGHMSRIAVKVGQRVTEGQVIGTEGATGNVTGPHLHFEIHYPGSGDRNGWNRTRNPRLDFEAAGIKPGVTYIAASTGGSTVSTATATQLKSHHERQSAYQQEVRDLFAKVEDRLDDLEDRLNRGATANQVNAVYVRQREYQAALLEALEQVAELSGATIDYDRIEAAARAGAEAALEEGFDVDVTITKKEN